MKITHLLLSEDQGKTIRTVVKENYPLSKRICRWMKVHPVITIDKRICKIQELIAPGSCVLEIEVIDEQNLHQTPDAVLDHQEAEQRKSAKPR